eukprot:353961-Chlamydomonas_euryale.AAC.2
MLSQGISSRGTWLRECVPNAWLLVLVLYLRQSGGWLPRVHEAVWTGLHAPSYTHGHTCAGRHVFAHASLWHAMACAEAGRGEEGHNHSTFGIVCVPVYHAHQLLQPDQLLEKRGGPTNGMMSSKPGPFRSTKIWKRACSGYGEQGVGGRARLRAESLADHAYQCSLVACIGHLHDAVHAQALVPVHGQHI